MFVLSGPDAVLVLRNVGGLPGLNAAVATAGSAAPGPVVFSYRRSLGGGGGDERETNPNDMHPETSAAGCGESRYSALHDRTISSNNSGNSDLVCLYPFHPAKSIDSEVRGENSLSLIHISEPTRIL